MIVDASAFVLALGDASVQSYFSGSDICAPDLIVVEALNAFWKIRRAGMNAPDTAVVLDALDAIEVLPSRAFADRAAALAASLDHSVYDCLYLAVAEARSETLLTADVRLDGKLIRSPLRKLLKVIRA